MRRFAALVARLILEYSTCPLLVHCSRVKELLLDGESCHRAGLLRSVRLKKHLQSKPSTAPQLPTFLGHCSLKTPAWGTHQDKVISAKWITMRWQLSQYTRQHRVRLMSWMMSQLNLFKCSY
ncbi:hypothetical protein MRX96_058717 [Rhipicephalus microplus]